MELDEKIEALSVKIKEGKLGRSTDFANNLIRGYRKFGKLTERQEPWVDRLLARADGHEEPGTATLPSFAGVYALFQRARAHLKYPKITLLLPGNKGLKLYMSGPRSTKPDMVNLVEPNQVGPDRAWYGRVAADGKYTASRSAGPLLLDITTVLTRLASEPEKVAAEYGKLTGNCCFCSLPLSDARSLSVGYGPICAKHYGLAWGGKDEPTIEEKVGIEKEEPVTAPRRVRVRRAVTI